VGLGPELLAQPERWPFLVLFPQKPAKDDEWEQHEAALLAMLDEVSGRYNVDPNRVLLTGLSQGGHGTWVLGARHPERWAALVPVCGYPAAPMGFPRAFAVPLRGSAESRRPWPGSRRAFTATDDVSGCRTSSWRAVPSVAVRRSRPAWSATTRGAARNPGSGWMLLQCALGRCDRRSPRLRPPSRVPALRGEPAARRRRCG
jgi:poly(3-hydroxybutyrate) depolymerase